MHHRFKEVLSADAEVVGTSDGGAVHRRGWIYRDRQYSFFELATDDAALFRAELKSATNALTAKVVDLLIGGAKRMDPSAEHPKAHLGRSFRQAGEAVPGIAHELGIHNSQVSLAPMAWLR